MRGCAERLQQGGEVAAGGNALAGHAGVELQVDGEALVAESGRGGAFESVDVFGGPKDRRERVLDDASGVGSLKTAHDENAGLAVGQAGGLESLADADALFEVAHT